MLLEKQNFSKHKLYKDVTSQRLYSNLILAESIGMCTYDFFFNRTFLLVEAAVCCSYVAMKLSLNLPVCFSY